MISMVTATAHRSMELARAPGRVAAESDYRELAHGSRLGTITDSSVAGHSAMPSGYEAAYQLVLPYAGLFSYTVGRQSWLVDANKILLIRPGWEFVDAQPVAKLGHAALLINPAGSMMDETFGPMANGRIDAQRFGAAASSPGLWLLTRGFLADDGLERSAIEADEWMIRVVSLASGRPRTNLRPATRAVRRAKEFLHCHGSERLSLSRIADAVGVSPVYLSNEFTRIEGMPLYQYQLHLRLIQALHQLRDCEDITELALDLGFSSHSHFGATFRRTFGVSPSEYRRSLRSRRPYLAGPILGGDRGIAALAAAAAR